MDTPYIDIHTHSCGPEVDVRKVCVYLLGRGEPLPDGDFVAGVHPWDVQAASSDLLRFFDNAPANMIGMGEIGLDFSPRYKDSKELQVRWLNDQLAIARQKQWPVVLHCVKAYNEIQVELKKYRLKSVLFHGFIGSEELANQLTEQGYYLSFGEFSFHSPKTGEALKSVPIKQLFVETDDDPGATIHEVYGEAAVALGLTLEELKKTIADNYQRFFYE